MFDFLMLEVLFSYEMRGDLVVVLIALIALLASKIHERKHDRRNDDE